MTYNGALYGENTVSKRILFAISQNNKLRVNVTYIVLLFFSIKLDTLEAVRHKAHYTLESKSILILLRKNQG